MPLALPAVTVLLIAGGRNAHPAGRAQSRQGHDGGLASRHRQTGGLAVCTGPVAKNLIKTVVRVRQALPDGVRNRRNRPAGRVDSGGQVQPLLRRNAPKLSRLMQAATVMWLIYHPQKPPKAHRPPAIKSTASQSQTP